MADNVKRLRGRTLQALRLRYFSSNSLCAHCLANGLTRAATELDHVVALVNGGDNSEDNYQGLCKSCHADKTRTDLGFKPLTKFDDAGRVIW